MDSVIYPFQLSSVFDDVSNDLKASGRGDKCACCNKPFNSKSRKFAGLSRLSFGSPIGVLSWSFALCRSCTKLAKRNGGAPEKLRKLAFDEARLLLATPGGAA